MRQSGPIMETMNRLQESGYDVTARVIAVHERYSIAGIHLRYEQQKAEKGFGRATAIETHDQSYKGMPATIELIERYKLASRVEVYDRQNHMVYENERRGSEWLREPAVKAAVEAERQRPQTPEERQQHETEWSTVLSMMAARGAGAREVEQARELARRDDDRQRPERGHDGPDYER